jgi:hypothetical protein
MYLPGYYRIMMLFFFWMDASHHNLLTACVSLCIIYIYIERCKHFIHFDGFIIRFKKIYILLFEMLKQSKANFSIFICGL